MGELEASRAPLRQPLRLRPRRLRRSRPARLHPQHQPGRAPELLNQPREDLVGWPNCSAGGQGGPPQMAQPRLEHANPRKAPPSNFSWLATTANPRRWRFHTVRIKPESPGGLRAGRFSARRSSTSLPSRRAEDSLRQAKESAEIFATAPRTVSSPSSPTNCERPSPRCWPPPTCFSAMPACPHATTTTSR